MKQKKITYKQLMSYVDFLEKKINYNVNILSRTFDLYIKYKKDDKAFLKYLKDKENQERQNGLQTKDDNELRKANMDTVHGSKDKQSTKKLEKQSKGQRLEKK